MTNACLPLSVQSSKRERGKRGDPASHTLLPHAHSHVSDTSDDNEAERDYS